MWQVDDAANLVDLLYVGAKSSELYSRLGLGRSRQLPLIRVLFVSAVVIVFACDGSPEATSNASGGGGGDCAADSGEGILMCEGGCTSPCGCDYCQFEGITKPVDGGVLICMGGGCYRFWEGTLCGYPEDAPCANDEYCVYGQSPCGGRGLCAKKPSACNLPCDGVCGCDGKYYCNGCSAFAAGIGYTYADKSCIPDGGDAGAADACATDAGACDTD